jgi:hypothetical protein
MALATALSLAAHAAAGPPGAAVPLRREKYLLLDDRIIEPATGVRLAVGQVTKHPRNPLFVEDRPWEVRFDNVYANVIYDAQENVYKCWYSPFVIDSMHQTTPRDQRGSTTYRAVSKKLADAGRWQREMGICYATSQDGLAWTKPLLDLQVWQGQPSNILAIGPHGAGIFKDPNERDPSRRYKLFTGMTWAVSADGVHWGKPTACPEVEAVADTHNNALWVPELRRYVGFTRNWDGGQRIVARTESPDFVHWSRAAEVLRGASPQWQTYAMPVFRYAELYLGLLMVMDTDADRVHCELAWSPDTSQWHRVDAGTPLIPNATTPGAYDWGTVYAAACPVIGEQEIRLYYGGGNGPHSNWRDGCLALATLRPDGFAGMRAAAGGPPGRVQTRPLLCTGRELRLTADARAGSVRVRVLAADQRLLATGEPITGNVTRETVRWTSPADLAQFSGQPIRCEFELQGATLYAFEFAP